MLPPVQEVYLCRDGINDLGQFFNGGRHRVRLSGLQLQPRVVERHLVLRQTQRGLEGYSV